MSVRSASASLNDVRLIPLGQHFAPEGVLTVAQTGEHLPFRVERCFLVSPAAKGTTRGHHAHRALRQFFICLSGEVTLAVDDGISKTRHELRSPSHGLLVPPGIWCSQTYQTDDASLLVLCDMRFQEADYIRDYDAFVGFARARREIMERRPVKINLGSGGRPLPDYINIDMDSLEQIRARYPEKTIDDDTIIVNFNIFNLPFEDGSVDEIRSEALIEHLSFVDEPRFFNEMVRVLKPGGSIYLTTVDFEKVARQWLEAADDWKDFYRNDEEAIRQQHWFGTNSYAANNRWGYLTATVYGSQNGAGQFHTNAYSEKKLRAICARLNLDVVSIDRFQWQGDRDHMIAVTARKPL